MAATLIVSIIIIIVIGTYVTFNFASGGNETSITCSESSATFSVIQNSTVAELNFPIPAAPCEHQISLSGFSINVGQSSPISLSGNIQVNSRSILTTLILYVNGSYELYSDMAASHESSYTIQYNAVLGNATVPIFIGMSYSVEFVALFRDGTATTATAVVNATA